MLTSSVVELRSKLSIYSLCIKAHRTILRHSMHEFELFVRICFSGSVTNSEARSTLQRPLPRESLKKFPVEPTTKRRTNERKQTQQRNKRQTNENEMKEKEQQKEPLLHTHFPVAFQLCFFLLLFFDGVCVKLNYTSGEEELYGTEYSKNEKRQKREEKDFSAGIYLQLTERRVNIETRLAQLFLSLPPLLFSRSFARHCCAFGRLQTKQPIHTIHKKPLNSEARCRGERITELSNCYFFHFFSSYFHFYHATVAASHYHTIADHHTIRAKDPSK